jgi:hypothetical protein
MPAQPTVPAHVLLNVSTTVTPTVPAHGRARQSDHDDRTDDSHDDR